MDMDSADLDISRLSDAQQNALQQFTSVTDQQVEAAIPLLRRSEWNVQIAISRFFDGDSTNPSDHIQAAGEPAPARVPRRHQETLLNGSSSFAPRPAARGLSPAPRIVPQPQSQVNRRPPFIITVILFPINFLYRLISKPLGLFSYLFPFLQRFLPSAASGARSAGSLRRTTTDRRPLNPRDTAARFLREFEEDYGTSPIPFHENGYAHALDMARKDLKFLLVVLLSPEHDDTSSFVRQTLLSREVVDYITGAENNILVWAGTVQDSEAYQVSVALNCTKFPFAALIAHTPQVSSTAMSIVARIVGPTPPATFVAKLREAVGQHTEALEQTRATRASREAERSLREQQNSAYERSLAQDRERARQRREAEAARKRAEEEAREQMQEHERRERDMRQWKRWRAQRLSAEPGAEVEGLTRVSIRMPSGERVLRRFASEAAIEELYAFVECYDLLGEGADGAQDSVEKPQGYKHHYAFRLVSPMPRTVYDAESNVSVGASIKNNTNLVVEPLGDEEEEEASEG